MPQAAAQAPFVQVAYWRQPFGTRIRCALDLPFLNRSGLTTGLAIEASEKMRTRYGWGPFAPQSIRGAVQAVANLLSTIDAEEGTHLIYWGTGDAAAIQVLGFRQLESGDGLFLTAPRSTGTKQDLLPGLRYFAEGAHLHSTRLPASGAPHLGVYVFLLTGALDNFDSLQDYCLDLAGQVRAGTRAPLRLIAVGLGSDFREANNGQLQALAARLERLKSPILSMVVADGLPMVGDQVRFAVLGDLIIGRRGVVRDPFGQEVRSFAEGVPGAFEFVLPGNAKSFTIEVDGVSYGQTLP